MSLSRKLVIVLSGVFWIVVFAILRVEYLSKSSPKPPVEANYAAEIAHYYFEAFKASLFSFGKLVLDFVGGFFDYVRSEHDLVIALSTIVIMFFTGILGFSTVKLWISTEKLWDASKKQITLARDEFNASHRPRVTVRRVWTQLVENKPIDVEFTIINTGDGPVEKCVWNTHILMLKDIGEFHYTLTFDPKNQFTRVGRIEIGEGMVKNFVNDKPLQPDDFLEINNKTKFLHIVGFVAYTDNVGVTRRTGFFRVYDPDLHRFRLLYDRDYELEYQD